MTLISAEALPWNHVWGARDALVVCVLQVANVSTPVCSSFHTLACTLCCDKLRTL